MFKIVLKESVKIGDTETKELTFDFDSLTGEDVIAAEMACRQADPRVVVPELNSVFLVHLAARAAKVPELIIRDLPIGKFMKIKNAATSSLRGSEETEEAEKE